MSLCAALGATSFSGVEDVDIGPDGKIYFAVKGEGTVYRLTDSDPITGTTASVEAFVGGGASYTIAHSGGTSTVAWGNGNDNLLFDGAGNLWVTNDGDNNYIWVVGSNHTQSIPNVRIFGRSPAGSEPTGLTFSPDYNFLFLSLQHPNSGNTTPQLDAGGMPIVFNKSTSFVMARSGNLGNLGCPLAGTACDDGDPTTILDEQDGICNCSGIPANAIQITATTAQSSDDAEQTVATGNVNLVSSDLELIQDGSSSDQLVGIRFASVNLPAGSIVHRAYIQFEVDEVSSGITTLTIEGELSTNSATFTTANDNIGSRVRTAAAAAWINLPTWVSVGLAGVEQHSPFLHTIVSEISSLPGWASGKPMTFIVSGIGSRIAKSYNFASGAGAPILKIFYTSLSLPVEITAFRAEKQHDQTVVLEWKTAFERANANFEVQRGTRADNMATIGVVASKGNSNMLEQYQLIDQYPARGINYYRIRQLDQQGTSMYSNILAVDVDKGLVSFSVYPNPARFEVVVAPTILQTPLRLFDVYGHLLRELVPTDDQIQINIADLLAGVYFLEHGEKVQMLIVGF